MCDVFLRKCSDFDGLYPVQSSVNSLNGAKVSETSDEVIICNLTENDAEVTAEITESSPRAVEQGWDYLL